jgi:hypothetical protein
MDWADLFHKIAVAIMVIVLIGVMYHVYKRFTDNKPFYGYFPPPLNNALALKSVADYEKDAIRAKPIQAAISSSNFVDIPKGSRGLQTRNPNPTGLDPSIYIENPTAEDDIINSVL